VEAILIHKSIAAAFAPGLMREFDKLNVEVRGDARICELCSTAKPTTEADWGTEFLDLIVAVKTVPNLAAAIEHIQQHGSNHTDAILTESNSNASEFCARIQSSCTLVNASTRFNDGFQLGLGAEIGISTSKVHAYGPMGLEELTATRYVVRGTGQAR
jgi:glutamate-5-semialdehyde dehydrogenase